MSLFKTLPLLLLSIFLGCNTETGTDPELLAKAEKIHNSVITLDTHVDINPNNFTEEKNYTMILDTQVDLPKMTAGGLDVAFLIVYTGQGDLDQAGFDAAYENAVSKFLLMIGIESIYTSKIYIYEKYNFQELKK
jgi:membrane dipeptidase/D-alanyl-D-alanine dipeptidase